MKMIDKIFEILSFHDTNQNNYQIFLKYLL